MTHPGVPSQGRVHRVDRGGSRILGGEVCGSAAAAGPPLELGGKSAAIRFDDADLPAATAAGPGGHLPGLNNGQYCNSEHAHHRTCTSRTASPGPRPVTDVVSSLGRGQPTRPLRCTFGPLVSARQRVRVELIPTSRPAAAPGPKLTTGGWTPDRDGHSAGSSTPPCSARSPTTCGIAREEIFGPVGSPSSATTDVDERPSPSRTTPSTGWPAACSPPTLDRGLDVRPARVRDRDLRSQPVPAGPGLALRRRQGQRPRQGGYGPESITAYENVKSIFRPAG